MTTDKERAFLYDLYVSSDWSERIAELMDAHITLPAEGRALYVGSGTGDHALAIAARATAELEITGIDPETERTALARAKQIAAHTEAAVEFRTAQPVTLPFDDASFDFVIGDFTFAPAYELPELVAELVRVARPGARVAFVAVSASSFGEFFSLYWEALANTADGAHAAHVERLVDELPTAAQLETAAAREGIDAPESWTAREEFEFASGAEFLSAPLVAHFLLPDWLSVMSDDTASHEEARTHIARLIDEDHDPDVPWAFSIKATLVAGVRAGADD